ncbi:hypothetical protein L3X38_005570 [Prunus dulcis]|uniref:Uncharacterized protein n=1 Tax=Prunus dulcis TaxID=3755 RepID=A0AAD4ZR88_PRUDU|nr:hypothetical protein L3X38_005570 [Prunus dulcis]
MNKITERELTEYHVEFQIPYLVKWRIPEPIGSLSNPKDGEVAFFTDTLKLRLRLPLQPSVERILAHLRYASVTKVRAISESSKRQLMAGNQARQQERRPRAVARPKRKS